LDEGFMTGLTAVPVSGNLPFWGNAEATGMRRFVSRAAGLIAAGLCLATSAVADMPAGSISAFNKAVESGDTASILAASRTLGDVAMDHPEDAQSAIAAFQAATQLCLRGACGDAQPMADFLMAMEDGLPASRAEVEILAAYSKWAGTEKRKKKTDAAFRDVLAAHVSSTPSLLTISAYEAFYVSKTGSFKWGEMADRAHLAAEHLKIVRDILPNRWATAELVWATAAIGDDKDIAILERLTDLMIWIQSKCTDPAANEALRKVKYETYAWHTAIDAYFRSTDRRKYEDQLEAIEKRIEAPISGLSVSSTYSGRSFCSGKIVVPPEPYYPTGAARGGYFGAVILGVSFTNGEVSGIEVLAAVPDKEFERASLQGMKKFRWEFDPEQKNPDCTRTWKNALILPFQYVLG